MSCRQSFSLLCIRNINEFQVVLKLVLGEGVVAYACGLCINVQFLDLMKHTSGVPNFADDLTKVFGWILCCHYVRHSMDPWTTCSTIALPPCFMYATFVSPNHVHWLGLGEDVIAHMSRLSMMLLHVGNSHCFISFCVNVLWLIPMWSGVRTLVVLRQTTIGLAK